MNEELYKKQLMERFELIQSNQYSISYPNLIKPDAELLQAISELLQGHLEFHPSLFDNSSLLQLTSYLRYTHAYYSEKKFFELEQSLSLLLKTAYPEQFEESLCLLTNYQHFKQELMEHMREEEETFIPYVLWLGKQNRENLPSYGEWLKHRGPVSLNSFLLEHNHDTLRSHEFRKYVVQRHRFFESHSVYRVFREQLEFFCDDLQIHSAIEECVVLPRAIQAENALQEHLDKQSALN